jgi:serine/threonine-protein kinase
MRVYGFTVGFGVLAIQYYFGLFSAGIVVVTVGVYYFGQSSDRVQYLYLPVTMISIYLVAALLVSGGVVPDRGLFNAVAGLETRLFAVSQVTLVMALTARMATLSRRSMRAAMARSHEAMALARQGHALLVEAQQQLERALGIVIGQPSHYSGQIAGQFQLGVVIGVGAMGEVYAAEHVDTAQPAAVKLMRPSTLSRPDLVERFLREGAICSSLHSPHLVTIHEVGKLADGAPYMAMELLRGQDLAARLRKEGRLPPSEVVELARALAAGLSVVHEAGVVHRDLKPVNVFHAEQPGGPCWKILDFGISKPARSTGTLTDIGVVGTPGYMSPEQARGLPLDHRSDMFAMGVLLYRTLTGRPAFIGSDTPQIMFDVAYKMPEQPSAVLELLPSDVDLVFALALAKDPKDRFTSAHELADALALGLRQELAPEQRKRAHALLDALPWGEPVVGGMQAESG